MAELLDGLHERTGLARGISKLERARGQGLNSRRFEGREVEVAALKSRGRAGFEVDVIVGNWCMP
ncbi:hypothetical protein CRG98_029296 [Punica granatum]|uniref:Uncharacterized protein n=1 Tax=Punica granatum TaxID=22663 RepID=A0A2I0J2D4_PUNGR|nr:hypothetical protein CRG98_029296 [Punica granatum]